ncbi:hypothetical protein P4O66_009743 [Electrophorus voltai]|uniref:Uncharacterized protein n=1 Tax=Electrophorus voltai TaxID=2609070 RepID=A0AAD8ZFP9_9TELE|nr:hypothetical protein P4O66_009743 [Electrophorus voltai]
MKETKDLGEEGSSDPCARLLADSLGEVMMDEAHSKSDNIFSRSQSCGLLYTFVSLAWPFQPYGALRISEQPSSAAVLSNVSFHVTLISQSDDGVGLIQPPVGAATRPRV